MSTTSTPESASDAIELLLVGDNVATGHPEGLGFFYRELGDSFAGADLVFGNCEWPLTTGEGYNPSVHGRHTDHMNAEDAQAFKDAGFDAVSLANNHMMDWGSQGMVHSVEALEAAGVQYCGGGRTLAEAHQPVLIERDGVRVAYLSYTAVYILPCHPKEMPADLPQMATLASTTTYETLHRIWEQPATPPEAHTTLNPDQLEVILGDIRAAKEKADVVVVSWHWGTSMGHRKRVRYQTELGHACIDAGADVIVGTHPHVLQGIERYRNGVILYSLGNFVFWRSELPSALRHDLFSFVAHVELGTDGVRGLWLAPLVTNEHGQPTPASAEAGQIVFHALRQDCEALGTTLDYVDGRILVTG